MAVQGPSNSLSFWKEISEDPASGVHLVHSKLHLSLQPYYFSDIKKNVKHIIDSRLTSYEPDLGGILAGYGKVSILRAQGQTLFNLPDVHVDVEGDFYVFSLEVGKQLRGVVNRKSHDCLGCLVHGFFYISLPKPYTVNLEDWLGKSANLNDEVKFTVTKVDLQSQVLHIEGNIVEVIPTCKPEEVSPLGERSNSDSGVSIASEDLLQAESQDLENFVDSKMDKKRSKLSLTQRKKEALLSSSTKSIPKQSTSLTKANRSRQISDSEVSVSSNQEAGESMRLELSEDTANASVKSSDSDEEIRSPKAKAMKKQGSVSPQKNALRPSVLDSSSDSGRDDIKAHTPVIKAKRTPVSQKVKSTPKTEQKTAIPNLSSPSSASPSKASKKRKRGDTSISQESPNAKKAKTNHDLGEDNAESVDDLVVNVFAAFSKNLTAQLQSEAESTPKNKKGKKVNNTQEKKDSFQPSTPKNMQKVGSPKKVSGSSRKVIVECSLDDTINNILDKYYVENTVGSEPMEVDEETLVRKASAIDSSKKKIKRTEQKISQSPLASPRVKESPASKNKPKPVESKQDVVTDPLSSPALGTSSSKKKIKATDLKISQSPLASPKAKEAPVSKNKAKSVDSKQDVDVDEGVYVSETPLTKASKVKVEKTSTPVLKAREKAVETKVPSTPVRVSVKHLEGITPIKSSPAAKSGSKEKVEETKPATPKTKPEKKSEDNDDDPEKIIQELLQSTVRASPFGSSKKKASSTPAQPKGDGTKTQSSIKKPEVDSANNKRRSLQPKKGKQLKMEDDRDLTEKTVMKILQSVQPKEKTKLKASNK